MMGVGDMNGNLAGADTSPAVTPNVFFLNESEKTWLVSYYFSFFTICVTSETYRASIDVWCLRG